MKKLLLITGLLFVVCGSAQAELASPQLLTPEDGTTLPLKKAAKFTWKKVTGSTKYRLIFSKDKSFSNYDTNKFKCLNSKNCFVYNVTSASYNLAASHPMLKADGSYFWQVQAVNSKDSSQFKTATTNTSGEVRSFSVGTAPSQYSKIANNGSMLPDSAVLGTAPTDWACTEDNKTGLVWEVKTTDGGLRDQNNTYNWYNPDPATNGYATYFDKASVDYKPEKFVGDENNGQNTLAYTQAANATSLCGASNWRLPTKSELESLVYCSDGKYNKLPKDISGFICTSNNDLDFTTQSPTINNTYFPDMHFISMSYFLSSSPLVNFSEVVWVVNFYNGSSARFYKDRLYVRLVR